MCPFSLSFLLETKKKPSRSLMEQWHLARAHSPPESPLSSPDTFRQVARCMLGTPLTDHHIVCRRVCVCVCDRKMSSLTSPSLKSIPSTVDLQHFKNRMNQRSLATPSVLPFPLFKVTDPWVVVWFLFQLRWRSRKAVMGHVFFSFLVITEKQDLCRLKRGVYEDGSACHCL